VEFTDATLYVPSWVVMSKEARKQIIVVLGEIEKVVKHG